MTSGMSLWPPNIQENMSATTPTNTYAPTHHKKERVHTNMHITHKRNGKIMKERRDSFVRLKDV